MTTKNSELDKFNVTCSVIKPDISNLDNYSIENP